MPDNRLNLFLYEVLWWIIQGVNFWKKIAGRKALWQSRLDRPRGQDIRDARVPIRQID